MTELPSPTPSPDIPKATTPTVELTPEQRQAIFGLDAVPAGESVTITLTASDGGIAGGGAQSFTVTKDAAAMPEDPLGMLPDEDEGLESSPDEDAALGYKLGDLRRERKAARAPINLTDLERD